MSAETGNNQIRHNDDPSSGPFLTLEEFFRERDAIRAGENSDQKSRTSTPEITAGFQETGKFDIRKAISALKERTGRWWGSIKERFSRKKETSEPTATTSNTEALPKNQESQKEYYAKNAEIRLNQILFGDMLGTSLEHYASKSGSQTEYAFPKNVTVDNALNKWGLFTSKEELQEKISQAVNNKRGTADEKTLKDNVDALRERYPADTFTLQRMILDKFMEQPSPQTLRKEGSTPTTESAQRVQEIFASGRESGSRLKELLSADSDARDQFIALGFNILTNAAKLNPLGLAGSALVKMALDLRSMRRAEDNDGLQNYVEQRFQQTTNRSEYAEYLQEQNGIDEQAEKKAGVFMRIVGRVFRFGADAAAIYSNVFKKVAIGAHNSGKDVDAFVEKYGQGQDIETVVKAVEEMASNLNKESLKKDTGESYHTKLIQLVKLSDALTDLGIIGDVIPPNYGEKIGSFVSRLFGRNQEATTQRFSRNPESLKQLRAAVDITIQALAADFAMSPNEWKDFSQEFTIESRKAVLQIIERHDMDSFRKERAKVLAKRLMYADVLGMFANGGLVYAATHLEEARQGAEAIGKSFQHEASLADISDKQAAGPVRISENYEPSSSHTQGRHTSEILPDNTETAAAPTPETPEKSIKLKLDSVREVQYATMGSDGIPRFQLDENNAIVGTDTTTGNTTTDGGWRALATPDNPSGTWIGRLQQDLNIAGIEPDSLNGFTHSYLLPLSREIGRNFSASELKGILGLSQALKDANPGDVRDIIQTIASEFNQDSAGSLEQILKKTIESRNN